MRQVKITEAYKHAKRSGGYDLSCYMMSNESEYWAEGTQAWFDATVREGERAAGGGRGPYGITGSRLGGWRPARPACRTTRATHLKLLRVSKAEYSLQLGRQRSEAHHQVAA